MLDTARPSCIYLFAQIKINAIISSDTNNTEIVLIGEKGLMSAYR